jgi:hypothetical protein
LGGLPPSEEFADDWRGVVLCEPDQPGLPDGPHAERAGDFYLFGDVVLIERVKPEAARISLALHPGRRRKGGRWSHRNVRRHTARQAT